MDTKRLASIGEDVQIAETAIIKRPHKVYIGDHVAISDYVVIACEAHLLDYIHVSDHVTIIGGDVGILYMSDFTTISAGSRIVCASDEYKGYGLVGPTIPVTQRDVVLQAPIYMRRFSAVASGCVISPGVILAEGSVIGANSYVPAGFRTEPWGIYAGSPVRKVGVRRSEQMYAKAKELGYE